MSRNSRPSGRPDPRRSLERDVERYERRERGGSTFWRSLSVLGAIGWSIAIPAAAGAWLGHRLDARLGSGVHLTLILLTVGVMVGSAIAWRVVRSHGE